MTNPHLTILTGASRGMGLAMAQQLLQQGHQLLCISRNANAELAALAESGGHTLIQWQHDLSDVQPVAERLAQWLAHLPGGQPASATLINNAGVLPEIAPLSASDPVSLSRALRIGLEAPMLLASAFLRATGEWMVPRKVLNISSGLGRRAMASQSAYCAAKAGMDHFTRCLALDEARLPHGARVCSLAPGIIDTDMQVQLRGTGTDVFPDAGNFASMKANGKLASPEEGARSVLGYLQRADFGSNPVADVRD